MSSSFKVQRLPQIQQSYKPQVKVTKVPLPQINFITKSIQIMNFSPHSLLQTFSQFFNCDEGYPPYRQVEKAFQIISGEDQDEMLKTDLQKEVLKNIHRKRDVFVFICLWTQYQNIQSIIKRWFDDKKAQQKIAYLILFQYIKEQSKNVNWYVNLAIKNQISALLQLDIVSNSPKVLQQLDAQISSLNIQSARQFEHIMVRLLFLTNKTQARPLNAAFKRILINFLKNKSNLKFLQPLIESALSSCHLKTQKIETKQDTFSSLVPFLFKSQAKECKQIVQGLVYSKIQHKFNSESYEAFYGFISNVFVNQNTGTEVLEFIKNIIKAWFVCRNNNALWNFLESNYSLFFFVSNKVENEQAIASRNFILGFLCQLSKWNETTQGLIQQLFISRYIYHFFQGRGFNFSLQLQNFSDNKASCLQAQFQTISKAFKHIQNFKFMNIMLFNKSNSLPSHWRKSENFDQMIRRHKQSQLAKKVLIKAKEIWDKVEENNLKQNKKIQLVFSVLRVQIDKVPISLSVEQLLEMLKYYESNPSSLKSYQIPFNKYQQDYLTISAKADTSQSKNQQKLQQLHPIIIQARIIKLMKKQLKRASTVEISQSLQLAHQKIQQSIKKLVTKGFLQEHQDQTYSYQP